MPAASNRARNTPGSGRGWRPAPVGAVRSEIQVQVQRTRQVPGVVRHASLARAPQIPATVDHAQRRIVDGRGKFGDRDQRPRQREAHGRNAQRSGVSPIGRRAASRRRSSGPQAPGHVIPIPRRPGPRSRLVLVGPPERRLVDRSRGGELRGVVQRGQGCLVQAHPDTTPRPDAAIRGRSPVPDPGRSPTFANGRSRSTRTPHRSWHPTRPACSPNRTAGPRGGGRRA